MAYRTRYSLEFQERTPSKNPLQSVLGEPPPNFQEWLSKTSKDLDGFDPFEESCSWYDHEKDMKALSREFSGYSFCLTGHGEEKGDIWKKYFFRGQMQVSRARIAFDPPWYE